MLLAVRPDALASVARKHKQQLAFAVLHKALTNKRWIKKSRAFFEKNIFGFVQSPYLCTRFFKPDFFGAKKVLFETFILWRVKLGQYSSVGRAADL